MSTTLTMTMDALKPQVPQLPTRSSRRVTTLLASLPHKLDAEEQTELSRAAPLEHDHYLSSEEDASSSADDLSSEYSLDSDYDEDLSPLSTNQRTPVEQVTARAVSVIFSGKPSIVNLPRRSTGPSFSSSSSSSSLSLMPPSRASTTGTEASAPIHPSFAKRMSIMSFRSANTPSHTAAPRSSIKSRPNSVMLVDIAEHRGHGRPRPNFLDSDPFPSPPIEAPVSPRLHSKTPGTMLKKTFNLVKRRSSRARLSQAENSSLRDDMSMLGEHDEDRTTTAPASLVSPSKLRSVRGGLVSMARPKSSRY
jgi:hypothetical protein